LLILLIASLHLIYLAWNCPLDLAPDEAHYWDWSRHLDWSYYSKGPLVAYLIRATCLAVGPWLRAWTAGDMLAVRLPAVVCGSLLLLSLYVLTVQVFGREKLAFGVVGLAVTLPVVAAGSSLMTIDAPYTCCWAWALVFGHRAMFRPSSWLWPVLGLVIGLGILAKYTMILWIPSAGLFLLTTPTHRRFLVRPGFWVMAVVAAMCCLPILIWNIQHDWVSLRHVGGQAGFVDAPGLRWFGPLVYVGTQCALLLGFWFVAWAAAMIAHRPTRESDPGVRYLWWMSAPTFTVFLLFSLQTPEEPNWPITAYLSGLVLTANWISHQLQSKYLGRRNLLRFGLACGCGLGLSTIGLMHYSVWVQPLLVRLSGEPTAERPLPLRRFDPTCRLRGWRLLAEEVDRVREQLRAEGAEPVLAAASWTLPGELGFYCKGHPTVYSFGLALGDRHSQYDLWGPNPVFHREPFQGRTFVFVGDVHPCLAPAFDRLEPSRVVTYEQRGKPIARWSVTICRGFRGFPPPPTKASAAPF
jgi:hypothetical protein